MSAALAETIRVVLVTAPDLAAARTLARRMVEGRMAACVNLLPAVESVYRWQGALESANEVLLVIKTSAERLAELEGFVAREHPYEVPEFVVLDPSHVGANYLAWLVRELRA